MITVRYLNGKSICLVTIYLYFFFPFWHDIGYMPFAKKIVCYGRIPVDGHIR